MKIGFIDYYLDEWHANNYPGWFKEVDPDADVAYGYAMIDSPKGGLSTDEWCQKNHIERCCTIEEIVEKSDVLAVLSPDNCELHEALCQLPLRSGKRVYIDKTFAPDLASARRIFALADQYHTPCYSTSALRFAKEYQGIDPTNIAGIAGIGGNAFEIYVIHQIEPILMLMRAPVKRVMGMPSEHFYTLTLEFTDGRLATINGYTYGLPFSLHIAMKDGTTKAAEVVSDCFKPFIRELIRFYKTGALPVEHEETLQIMAAREAAVRAMALPGQWISL